MRRTIGALILALALFSSCDLWLAGEPGIVELEDVVRDVRRPGDFDYEVYLPVQLSIAVESVSSARSAGDEVFVVHIEGSDGSLYFSGSFEPGGTLEGEIVVPGALDSATLTLSSASYETRVVTISEPAAYLEVDRTLAVIEKGATEILPDRDGDGIDDPYDAFPDDPELAFTRSIPASGELTVAFEDNFPALGDADFNDFVATYSVVEYRNAKNKLVQVKGRASAVARGAGFDHEFGLLVDHPGTPVSASIDYRDGSGVLLGSAEPDLTEPVVLELFTSTIDAFDRTGGTTMDNVHPLADPSIGHVTDFVITYAKDATEVNTGVWTPYNPYLRVLTNDELDYVPDIHLINRSALPTSENPAGYEDFRDPDTGTPWALLVPNDWLWPRESRVITVAYPEFADWRDSMGESNSDWYLHPETEYVVPR